MKKKLYAFYFASIASIAGAEEPRVSQTPTHHLSIRGGAIVLKVTDYDTAREAVLQTAERESAELLDARTAVNEKGRRNGWMSLRVDADRSQKLLAGIRVLGKLYAESVNFTENASEYQQLERRIGRLREHQARLSGILTGSRRLRGSDILYVQERLFRAGVDEGELLQRRLDIERAARTFSVNVTLFEPGALPTVGAERADIGAGFTRGTGLAWNALQRLAARGASAAAFGIVFAPVWIPVLLILWLAFRLLGPIVRSLARELREAIQDLFARRRIVGPTRPLP